MLAAGGTGYAAGKITGKQIKNETIQSKDVKNGTLTGADVADGSLSGADLSDSTVTGADVADASLGSADLADGSVARTDLNRACAAGEVAAFGGCVRLVPTGPSSYDAAVADCSSRGGRLPTSGELVWIATHLDYTWADSNVGSYEFSGSFTSTYPLTPLAIDRTRNLVANSSGQDFWHHCVTS
ncbi:hypothetical protein G5V58_18460 [Nocardioides anomalus]|uniref:Pentapeptide repeat-containing protein n=1 Tax=Nocardioides anomalus TaxID=2712223 RepID=A0A6G6WH07_9ACTN|nr:hypothetical protein [Nocardioides anomalus]QIG44499.1 hypothetical protein G5V58_18460 [Nocardioides anomalus]